MPTTLSTETPKLVTFSGGFVADWHVVRCLLDLEAKGATFVLLDGDRIRVEPSGLLDADSRDLLRAHRAEAVAVLRYQADDSHLLRS